MEPGRGVKPPNIHPGVARILRLSEQRHPRGTTAGARTTHVGNDRNADGARDGGKVMTSYGLVLINSGGEKWQGS